jgi:Tol biopolymer transport system component/beta-lactamase regulating signal transducer with metallopeptidase domain
MFNLIPQLVPQRQTEYARAEVSDETLESDVAEKNTSESKPVSETGAPPETAESVTVTPVMREGVESQSKPAFLEVADVLPSIWLAGALVLAVYVCANNFNLLRIVKRERPLTDQKILDLLEDCKAEMGIRTILGIVTTDKVKSPALFGFIRPRLLLPKGMLETLSREELRYVFLHELAHLKRHDIYIGYLSSLLQVLHWFNPLIWLAFHRLRADRELACDALVLARTQSGQAKDYGRTIVCLLERFSRPRHLPAMAGILETKAQLKRRIKMIARFKKNSYQWSPWAILLIIILACISLPDARRTRASETLASKPAQQPDFRKIWIPTKPGNGVLSPDGKKFAFVSKRRIWVVPVHGKVSPDIAGEPVRLRGTEGAWRWGMSWSADGKWIAYNNLKNDEICIVPSSGGKVKRISVNKNRGGHLWNYRLSLSPDGKIVAFAAKEKGEIQLFTVNVEGADVNQLTEDGGTQPAFSPDGKKITYVKEKPQKAATHRYISTPIRKSDVWVILSAGGTPVQVSDLPGRAIAPIWSPDGKMVAFTRTAEIDESKEICIVPVSEAGNPEASTTQIELPLETWDFLAGWTPDNKIGVLLTEPRHQAIYTVPASGGNATQVTPQGNTFHPRWSPDGERIYFRWNGGDIASVPSEGGEISIGPIDADSKIFVALSGGGNVVSPDGKKVVFAGAELVLRDNEKTYTVDIYTVPIEGGEPKKLTISPGQDRFPCWSPDGKSIAFIRYPENPEKKNYIMNICIVPTEGGEVRQLTSESDKVAWANIAWSPNGKSIAYFSEDKAIKVIPVQGGQPRIVVKVEDVNSHSELAWSPDARKLAYSSKGSIWVVSLDGGEPEEIKTGLDAKSNHLSWSPDGKKIAFSAAHGGDQELWLMENFLPTGEVNER